MFASKAPLTAGMVGVMHILIDLNRSSEKKAKREFAENMKAPFMRYRISEEGL